MNVSVDPQTFAVEPLGGDHANKSLNIKCAKWLNQLFVVVVVVFQQAKGAKGRGNKTLTRATKVNVLHPKCGTYVVFRPSDCRFVCVLRTSCPVHDGGRQDGRQKLLCRLTVIEKGE